MLTNLPWVRLERPLNEADRGECGSDYSCLVHAQADADLPPQYSHFLPQLEHLHADNTVGLNKYEGDQ
jgi:hypothetical protein